MLLSAPVIVAALRGGGIPRIGALLGTVSITAGVMLRLSAMRRIGRGARVFRAHAGSGLITSGPYCWSRNPLYLASALMLCGLGLLAGAEWLAVALLPATVVAYTPVVLVEERALSAQLGEDYRRYQALVPRWVGAPRVRRERSIEALVPWPEVFRREKRLVPGCLIAALGIVALRHEWLPLAALARRVETETGVDLTLLVVAGVVVGFTVNAIKVERHQKRRRAARSASRGIAAGC